jgi:hypothetical protein
MQHMTLLRIDIPTLAEFRELAASQAIPAFSLYVPTSPLPA